MTRGSYARTPEHNRAIGEALRRRPLSPTDDRETDIRRAQRLLPDLTGLECVYCGAAARDRDHVIPWPRGRAVAGNILPACHRCNMSKGNRTPEEWLADGLIGKARQAAA